MSTTRKVTPSRLSSAMTKYPEHRNAFTYIDKEVPSRYDKSHTIMTNKTLMFIMLCATELSTVACNWQTKIRNHFVQNLYINFCE